MSGELETPAAIDTGHGSPEEAVMEAKATEREVHDRDWQKTGDLEAPPARPGFCQKWIRTHIGNEADHKNLAKRFREGWTPRRLDSVHNYIGVPALKEGEFAGIVGVFGMILCEMPLRMKEQRDAFYREKLRRQTEAIDHDLHKAELPGAPIHVKRRTASTKGVGAANQVPRSVIADDDPLA